MVDLRNESAAKRFSRASGGMLRTEMFFAFVLLLSSIAASDEIEFLNGTNLTGKVTQIDKKQRRLQFTSKIGSRTNQREFSFDRIHAVTYRGKRYVLNEKPPLDESDPQERVERTEQEVQELIRSVGATKPDWLDSVRLNYPRTLDLSWSSSNPKAWNNAKDPGAYVWDVINPNPHRWREGVKLMYHLIEVNQDNRQAQLKAMNQLGTLYGSLFRDWPRAAFWWQEAGPGRGGGHGGGGFASGYENGLAACYWHLGNKELAMQWVQRAREPNPPNPHLLAEMGEYDRALQAAEKMRRGWRKDQALLYCGDVCRHAGWYDKALDYYQQAADLPKTQKYQRTIPRANDRIEALQAERLIDVSKLRDGIYRGTALGYNGTLDVTVVLRQHHIQSVKVSRHIEKQCYSSLTDIPAKIVQKQSTSGVDATSGATITSEAVLRAATRALSR